MVLLQNNLDKGTGMKMSKSRMSMHNWAQVNNWRSRPSTKASTRLSLSVFSPKPEFGFQPDPGFQRCQTTLERPYTYKPARRHRESCTLDYIRYLEDRNKESEAKLKNTMNVLSMQRSKSDLDHHEIAGIPTTGLYGGGIFKERSQIYLTNTPDLLRGESGYQGNKQEMKVGMAVVPRKGLIHLSTNDTEQQPIHDYAIHGGKQRLKGTQEYASPKTKSLIRRKDIMAQIQLGTKLLEESEAQKLEEEELSKSLGDYTIMDLQTKLLEMTDAKSIRRQSYIQQQESSPVPPKKKDALAKMDKPITLPAIKNLNPFSMKSK